MRRSNRADTHDKTEDQNIPTALRTNRDAIGDIRKLIALSRREVIMYGDCSLGAKLLPA